MNKFFKAQLKNYKNFLLIIALYCGLISSANAATLADVVNSVNLLRVTVLSRIDAWVGTMNKLMFEPNPSLPVTMAANSQEKIATGQTASLSQSQSISSSTTALTRSGNKEALRLSDIPAIDLFITPPTGYTFKNKTINIENGNKSFNIDSLLGPTAYENFDFQNIGNNPAYNFIQLAGNLYQSHAISLTNQEPKLKAEDITRIQNSPIFREYRAALRAYVAAQSVGASNLYQMMAARIPQQNLGAQAGMPNKDASLLQLQQYLATRRSQNPQWYEQMQSASPATVQRETLFVLAEMRDQLFQLQQQNERLVATMSIMQLQSNYQSSKLNLILLEQGVNAQIKEAQGLSPEGAAPTDLKLPGTE